IYAAKTMLKISRLTLLNTTADFIRGSEDRLIAIDKLIDNLTESLSNEEIRDVIMGKFYASLLNEEATWETNKEEASLENLIAQSKQFSTTELLNSLLFLKDIKIDDELLNKIDIRCNIVSATNDKLIPLEHSDHLHTAIKKSSISYIADSGHLLPIQMPNIL